MRRCLVPAYAAMPLSLMPCLLAPTLPTRLNVAAVAAVAAILAAGLHAGAAAAASAVVKPAPAASGLSAEDPGSALQAQVQRLIGRAACDNDSQCRTLPLGVRACGGPEAYLAWSALGTDQAALRRAAERYSQWQAQQQARGGAMSICMVEADPGAVCSKPAAAGAPRSGRCVLGTAASGSETR